jgi:diguanylate cyclase (GGDEF)-like protein
MTSLGEPKESGEPASLHEKVVDSLEHLVVHFMEAFVDATAQPRQRFDRLSSSWESGFSPQDAMICTVDFCGVHAGFFALSCDPLAIRKHVTGEQLKSWDPADITEDMCRELLSMAAATVLPILGGKGAAISIFAPRVIYGTVSFPVVPCLRTQVEIGGIRIAFYLTVDEMRTEVSRRTKELLGRNQALMAAVTQGQSERAQLQALANTDPLTGLHNRNGYADATERLLQRARQSGNSLAVMLIDVDYFKTINDTYGHPVGDRALCKVAATLRHVLRPGDVIARLGGDEFAVVFEGLSEESARAVVSRIEASLAQPSEEFSLPDAVKLSLSLGAAISSSARVSFDELSICADQSLYAAKRAGRAQGVVQTVTLPELASESPESHLAA